MQPAATAPLNLTVFRSLAFYAAFVTYDHAGTLRAAALPDALRFPPPGLGWVVGTVPLSETLIWACAIAFVVACVLGIIGWGGRWPAVVAFVLGLYLLGIPQLHGKVNHNHHVLWFLAIVAATPPAWMPSWQALLRGEGCRPVPATPLHGAWLLMGVLYFFPGFWKLGINAPGWFAGDVVRDYMWYKWAETGVAPLVRADASPWLYRPLGALVVVWELTFWAAMFRPATRKLWGAFGFAFHIGAWATLGISFFSMLLMYLTLVDWDGPVAPAVAHVRGRAVEIVSGTAVALFIAAGTTYTDSWPVAVYPTFARGPADTYTRIYSGAGDAHASTGLAPERAGELVKRVLALPDGPTRDAALAALGPGPWYVERVPIRPGSRSVRETLSVTRMTEP